MCFPSTTTNDSKFLRVMVFKEFRILLANQAQTHDIARCPFPTLVPELPKWNLFYSLITLLKKIFTMKN